MMTSACVVATVLTQKLQKRQQWYNKQMMELALDHLLHMNVSQKDKS